MTNEILDWTILLTQKIKPGWLRRNAIYYNLVTYINHTIALFIGRDYEGVIIFVRRADRELVRLEYESGYIVEPYFDVAKEYLLKMVLYLRENNLISQPMLEWLPEKYKKE